LFANDELLDELNDIARRHRATEASAILAKIELYEKYEKSSNLNGSMQHLVGRLRTEIDVLVGGLVGTTADPRPVQQSVIDGFGAECNARSGVPPMTLWQRVLSLANQ